MCVDARGDVYQWGDAFFGGVTADGSKPEATLEGKVSVAKSRLKGIFGLLKGDLSRRT